MLSHRILRVFVSVALLGLAALLSPGCGSSTGDAERPVTTGEPESTPTETAQISSEQLDQIKSFLDRKSRVVSRCFADAVEAGEIPSNQSGFVQLGFTIDPDGSLSAIKVESASHDSASLNKCAIERASSWNMVKIPRSLPYSYRFGFRTL